MEDFEKQFIQLSHSVAQISDELGKVYEQLALYRNESERTRLRLESAEEASFFARLAHKTIEEVIQNVIVAHFALTPHQLRGKGEKRRVGRRPISLLKQEMVVDDARLWLVCLMRQLTYQTERSLKLNYSWLQVRHFQTARQLIEAIQADKSHPERKMWRQLLGQTIDEGKRLGVDVSVVLDELTYA